MNRLIIGLAALAVAGCGVNDYNGGGSTAAQSSCAALTDLEIANTKITSAEEKSAGSFSFGDGPASKTVELPDHCYVEGISNERKGADDKTYGLGFALAMPVNWNGRFLFQGGGGLNGTVHPPLGGNAAGDTPALARGFAVISTDGGHKGQGGFDASFMADQQAALDFAGQSVAKVTELGNEVVKAHYGQAAHHTYISGCSTGGANAYDFFDLLSAVVDWVEDGEAPGDVIASREDPEPASRKLCAYPEHPHYIGGDEASADSYECR